MFDTLIKNVDKTLKKKKTIKMFYVILCIIMHYYALLYYYIYILFCYATLRIIKK